MNLLLGTFLRVKVINGIKIRILNPLEYHQFALLDSKVYEPEVTVPLGSILLPGMVVFDVGANLGYYTLLASLGVGSSGEVHAFEPSSKQFEHLRLNINLNHAGNVQLNNCAVADAVGERKFFLSGGWNSGTHSLAKTVDLTGECTVACTTIDNYVLHNRIKRIDLMKIDIEGGELLMLRGASHTLESIPPGVIVFEACEEHAQAFGYSTCDLKHFLIERGYTIFRCEVPGTLSSVLPSAPETFGNLVAIHFTATEARRRLCYAMNERCPEPASCNEFVTEHS